MRTELSKSEFLIARDCVKTAWLIRHRPHALGSAPRSPYHDMLAEDGRRAEAVACGWLRRTISGEWSAQQEFAAQGCYARADMVRRGSDGIHLYEIKSATRITKEALWDAAFQAMVAGSQGVEIISTNVVHINGDYVRNGEVDADLLFIVADVTEQVEALLPEVRAAVAEITALLTRPQIDEMGCECRFKGSIANRCQGFEHFNPDIVGITAHHLPRISRARLIALDQEGRLAIDRVRGDEVTATQGKVLAALQTREVQADAAGISEFLAGLVFPLSFYDYETFGSAIPIANGHSPHRQMPVQFSLHVLHEDGRIEHHEHLTTGPGEQADLVGSLEDALPASGTVLAWNDAFEKGCNRALMALLPGKAAFLEDINGRTRDLMVPFQKHLVHPGAEGSASIKKVLPAFSPSFTYPVDAVHDGAGAMVAWRTMVSSENPAIRDRLKRELLDYCRLDTEAMVELYRVLVGRMDGRSPTTSPR